MAKQPTITDLSTLADVISPINDNFDNIQSSFDNTLSRDGSTPNQMEADIDLNSNDLLNVGDVNADNLVVDGVNLNTKVAEAATSATNAATSETNAAASASAAATSETNAAASAVEAAQYDSTTKYTDIAAFLASTTTYPDNTYVTTTKEGFVYKAVSSGGDASNAAAQEFVLESVSSFQNRDADAAAAIASLHDGVVVSMGGLDYVTDSTATGTASATNDLSVDGLKPSGEANALHYGLSEGAANNSDSIQRAIDNNSFVRLPVGDYTFGTTIEVPTQVTIQGSGWYKTKLTYNGTAGTVAFTNGTELGRQAIMRDFELAATGNDHGAFQWVTSYSPIFQFIRVSGAWKWGWVLHDVYVGVLEDIDTTGTSFTNFIIGISDNSNKFVFNRVHTSSLPSDAATAMYGVIVNGGKGHTLSNCTLQGPTVGIALGSARGTIITNPYFENTVCNMVLGDPASAGNSSGTHVIGGTYSGPYSGHPQYANRGPIVFASRCQNVRMDSPVLLETGDSADANGPWPILFDTTASTFEVSNIDHFGSDTRSALMLVSGASPSITVTGGKYGSNSATEIILKADGSFGGVSRGIRVDNAGVVTADAYTPDTISGTVDALIDQAIPDVETFIV